MHSWIRDLRYSVRSLGRSPFFTICVAATLALGIGANTAMLTANYQLLVKRLPFPHAGELVAVYETGRNGQHQQVALANLLSWKALSRSFTSFGACRSRSYTLRGGSAEPGSSVSVLQVGLVTADFFATLSVQPAI